MSSVKVNLDVIDGASAKGETKDSFRQPQKILWDLT